MYGGHRGAIPNTTPAQRIAEHLEALKNEFETLENDSGVYKMQRDDLERKLEAQLNEFHTMRQTLIELERKHQKIKQQYEEEILRLRRLLEAATSNNNSIADGKGLPGQTGLLGQGPGGPSGKEGEAPFFPSQAGGGATVFPPLVPSHKGYNDLNKGDKRPETKRDFAPLPGSQQANGKHGVPSFGEIERGNEDTAAPAAGVSSSAATPAPRVGMEPSIQNLQGRADVGKTDWVVVYNPSVKTNVNINLLHNLDHQSVVCCVKFSQNGKYLATGCNKVAKIYDVETGEKVCSFPDDSALANSPMGSVEKEDSYVRSVCFSPDGQYLVAGAEDRTVKVWDIKSRTQRHSFQGHELDIYSLDFAPDGRYVVSGSGDGKAKIWNMKTGECMYTLGNEEVGPKEGVTSVAVSPDGRLVAAGSLDCVVRLWDAHTGQFLDSFKGHDDSVYSVAFSPDGKTLASGSLDKTLKIWDLASRPDRCISTLTGHRDYVLSVAFSPDGNWLISGSKDRSVQFWDPRSSILHLMLQGHKNSVISVALNPTMQMFATGSGDFRARIWKYSL